ncbi:MAG: SpoIIE family protein phosphatase [Gammaproteobacteria bacterium]|nr:SpoIIE family protein phosphatase [Gammaproteobacteria bacterium]
MNNTKTAKALIVDDEMTSRVILRLLLKKQGYETLEAENGQQAIELYKKHSPDIIFMDVMMPEVDGYEATRQIKAESGHRFVPVIFVTATTDKESLSLCIEAGGDDFMVKPYDDFVLRSKIHAMQRIATLNREIQGMYSMIHREQEIAESVFINAIQGSNISNPHIRSCIRPATTFSGDMMLSAYSPSRELFFLIGDFTGHGLSSALGAMPVSEVFNAMTSKGFDPEDVLSGINKKLNAMLPVGMFFGAQLVVISPELEHVRIFNVGMPDLLVISGSSNKILHRGKSNGLPLGVMDDIDYNEMGEIVAVSPSDKVLMYSDGLTEARNSHDEEFGEERLITAIHNAPGSNYFDHIFSDLDLFCGEMSQTDDVTLAELTCINEILPQGNESKGAVAQPLLSYRGKWDMTLKFSGARLRETNPVPILINQIMEMEQIEKERSSLFTAITELYVNALDHGVLGLKSYMKSDAAGFAHYFKQRKARFATLNTGHVIFSLAVEQRSDIRRFTLRVEDSGEGFDYKSMHSCAGGDCSQLCGRGIMLIKELSHSLSYEGKGNIANVVFEWRTSQ